jgi:hypothetical protein
LAVVGAFLLLAPLVAGASGPTYTTLAAPLPAAADNAAPQFTSVACPAANQCVAGGLYHGPDNSVQGLLATWSGGAWTTVETGLAPDDPALSPPTLSSVSAVGCAAPGSCTAVGSAVTQGGPTPDTLLFSGWGSSWQTTDLPLPADVSSAPDPYGLTVACASGGPCVVAGNYGAAGGVTKVFVDSGSGSSLTSTSLPGSAPPQVACPTATACVLAEGGTLWTGLGLSWSPASLPVPPGAAAVNAAGVSCPGVGHCVVLANASSGAVVLDTGGPHGPFVQTTAPVRSGGGSASAPPGGLACRKVGFCLALMASAGQTVLVSGWKTSWSSTRAPAELGARPGDAVVLSGVACDPTAGCTAVGSVGDRSELVSGSPGNWSAVPVPVPPDAFPVGDDVQQLDVVACAGGACLAGGRYPVGVARGGLMGLTGSADSWSAAAVPLPPDAGMPFQGSVGAVTCPAAGNCWAATALTSPYSPTVSSPGVLFDHRSASGWTPSITLLPSDAAPGSSPEVTGLACSTVAQCTAVGSYGAWSGGQGLILTRDGGAWTAWAAPLAAGQTDASLSSVSCQTGGGPCVAVGSELVWGQGNIWTPDDIPVPADAASPTRALLSAVDCFTTRCVAVGQYLDLAGQWQGLVVSGSPSVGWAASSVAPPAGATPGQGIDFTGVSCTGPSNCGLLGTYPASGGTGGVAVVTGLIGHWTVAAETGEAGLIGCPVAGTCTVVVRGVTSTTLLSGFGTTFSSVPAPVPSGTTLRALSCTRAPSCTVVGTTGAGSGSTPEVLTGWGSSWSGQNLTLPDILGIAPTAGGLSVVGCAPSAAGGTGCLAGGLMTRHGEGLTPLLAAS